VCDAIVGGGTVISNAFYNIDDATDPDQHEDVLYCTGNSTVACNIISNATAAAPVIYLEPNRSSTSGETLVYNNVTMGTGYAPISIDLGGGNPGTDLTIKIFNNTVEGNSATCVRVVDRNVPLGRLDVTNNWFLSSGNPFEIPSGEVTDLNEGKNLTNTVAQAATYGASEANNWKPTSASWPGIGAAENLNSVFTLDLDGATRGTTWDIGAYEYVSGGGGGTGSTIRAGTVRAGRIRKR
jgi:hypothetical protein